jgi:transcriptional regulator with XRE-family HTH domain
MALLLDRTVEKLERNYQHGYKHIDPKGKHWQALDTDEVIEALDVSIALEAINDTSIFLGLLYVVTAHQTYHVAVDEKSTLPYHSIEAMLAKGEGNPRLHKLENLLNALGASLAICRIEDRENDVPHEELQRACFFQDEMTKERWAIRECIELLFEYGLQFRIFPLADVEKVNTLTHCSAIQLINDDDVRSHLKMRKSVGNLLILLRLFNVSTSTQLLVSPSKTSAEV